MQGIERQLRDNVETMHYITLKNFSTAWVNSVAGPFSFANYASSVSVIIIDLVGQDFKVDNCRLYIIKNNSTTYYILQTLQDI